ncbi:MAG: YceI family protein [Gemmatimonadaceae bacterium]
MFESEAVPVWEIDPAHTNVEFAVRHLMISTVKGRFGGVSGSVQSEDGSSTPKVQVVIDVASIDTRQNQRDAHLRSPDFFDAARYPTIKFEGRKIDGDTSGEFRLIGDLTIRDISREVVLSGKSEGRGMDPWGKERTGFSLTGKIDRREFGLVYNQALETGGVLVGDEVKLSIDVELVRTVPEQVLAGSA